MENKLGLIILNNCKGLGNKINNHLMDVRKDNIDYSIPCQEVRFNNGEGKIVIKETIRDKDIFIISDVGNYNCTYPMFDYHNHMSPDDHFQDIKRVISAMAGNASRITVVMPLLYSSRQHKRKGRESLDCAIALQELERLGIKSIITFDAHDPNVQNAIPCLSFENFYPTLTMLDKFIETETINMENLLVISPDTGAMDRARYYADVLKCDAGMFYKRRDVSIVVDGKNPIVAHEYIGKDIAGKDVIVVDDMVASGDSIIDVIEELHKRKALNIYIFSTFSFFTKGIEKFDKLYKQNKFTKMYTTNLSYIPDDIRKKEWIMEVDCSSHLAKIIDTLNKRGSLSPLMNGKKSLVDKISSTKKD